MARAQKLFIRRRTGMESLPDFAFPHDEGGPPGAQVGGRPTLKT